MTHHDIGYTFNIRDCKKRKEKKVTNYEEEEKETLSEMLPNYNDSA